MRRPVSQYASVVFLLVSLGSVLRLEATTGRFTAYLPEIVVSYLVLIVSLAFCWGRWARDLGRGSGIVAPAIIVVACTRLYWRLPLSWDDWERFLKYVP